MRFGERPGRVTLSLDIRVRAPLELLRFRQSPDEAVLARVVAVLDDSVPGLGAQHEGVGVALEHEGRAGERVDGDPVREERGEVRRGLGPAAVAAVKISRSDVGFDPAPENRRRLHIPKPPVDGSFRRAATASIHNICR